MNCSPSLDVKKQLRLVELLQINHVGNIDRPIRKFQTVLELYAMFELINRNDGIFFMDLNDFSF